MKKKLIIRLALLVVTTFSVYSCRAEDEVLPAEEPTQFRASIAMFQKFDEKVQSDAKFRYENSQQDFQQPAERNNYPYVSTVNIPISAVSYKVPFKETISAFLANAENSIFSQEFYSKFGSPFYAVSTYTYGNNSKAIAFPILKGDQVTAFIHGIVTPARDYVQFTVVQNTEPATLQVLARLQYAVDNLYPSGPVMSRGIGTNEEHIRVNEIEEITIVKINHMDQTGGFILHHPGYDWWKDASWTDPKNGPIGGGKSMSGDGSKHKFPDYLDDGENSNKEIIDSLKKYPCAQNLVGLLPNLKNDIGKAMNSIFKNSKDYNITFRAKSGLGDIDGTTFSSYSSEFGTFKAVINLNDNVLENATKEYILVTMYHETIHAYLDYERFKLGNEAFQDQYPSVIVGYDYSTDGTMINRYKFIEGHQQVGPFLTTLQNILTTYNSSLPIETAKAMAKAGITTMTSEERELNRNERNVSLGKHKGTKCP